MPVYEYYCARCQRTFDLMRPMSRRDEEANCPQCGDGGQRQLSTFGFKDGRYGHFFKASAQTGQATQATHSPKAAGDSEE